MYGLLTTNDAGNDGGFARVIAEFFMKKVSDLQANISSRLSETAPTPLMSDVRYTGTEFNITDPTTNDEVADMRMDG